MTGHRSCRRNAGRSIRGHGLSDPTFEADQKSAKGRVPGHSAGLRQSPEGVLRATGLVEAAGQPSQGFRIPLLVETQTDRGFVMGDGFRFSTIVVVEDRQFEMRDGTDGVSLGLFNPSEQGCKTSSFSHSR